MSRQRFVRAVLAGLLLWGVFSETGPWTTICLTLVFLAFEVQARVVIK